MKKWLREFLIILIAWSGSLLITTLFLNQELTNHQQISLKGSGSDIVLLSPLPVSAKQLPAKYESWLTENNLDLVYQPATDTSANLVSKKLPENIRKTVTSYFSRHTTTNGEFDYIAYDHQTYLVYTVKSNEGYLALMQPKWGWLDDQGHGMMYVIAYILITLLTLIWFYKYLQHKEAHLRIISENVNRLTNHKLTDVLILKPGEDFEQLNQAINSLESELINNRKEVAVQIESYHRLIEHLTIGVILIDVNRQIILHNSAAEEMLSVIISDTPHPFIDDVRTYGLSHLIEKSFRKQHSLVKSIQLVGGDSERFVDATSVYLQSDTEEDQVMVLLNDVTATRQLAQIQMDFVSNVSHELKTPVTAISGFAETLLSGAKDDPKTLDEFLKIISDESKRLTALINDTLILSKRGMSQPVVAVPVKAILDETCQLLRQQIAQKSLIVINDFPADIKPNSEVGKIRQIIKNLLINAVFYNHDGGKIIISGTFENQQMMLSITDTGIGLAADEQKRIFERFYRVDRARSQHHGGTGLGLAIVKELTEGLGGKITVKSQLGVGSTFKVTLPMIDPNSMNKIHN